MRIKRDASQSLDDAAQNLAAAILVTKEERRPILVDIREATPLEDDVRRFYSGRIVVENFTALAMVVDAGPFGRMMANVYLGVAQLGIATRIFATEGDAVAWLLSFRSQ